MKENSENCINSIVLELQKGFCEKDYLMSMFDIRSERQIRKLIDRIKDIYPVISTSGSKGYKIANKQDEIALAHHTISEAYSRAREIIKGVQKLEAWVDEVENG